MTWSALHQALTVLVVPVTIRTHTSLRSKNPITIPVILIADQSVMNLATKLHLAVDLADITTPLNVRAHLVGDQVDTVILPPHLEFCQVVPVIVIFRIVFENFIIILTAKLYIPL